MRIYVDTSVFGGCFDPEFEIWSNRLVDLFKIGKFTAPDLYLLVRYV